MHFVKFETARIQDCIDFIQAKGLHRCWLRDGSSREVRVKATGGGAIRFAGGLYSSALLCSNAVGRTLCVSYHDTI
jgi:pantothenate kinase